MKKLTIFLSLFLLAFTAQAAVTVDTSPTSLVTSATEVEAGDEQAVFKFALDGDASETLDSVSVRVNSTTAEEEDLDEIIVYRDEGDGSFDGDEDDEIGSTADVNIGSDTVVELDSDNELDGDMFFLVLSFTSSWEDTDSVTVTLNEDGIETSDDSPSTDALTTSAITVAEEEVDTTAPTISSAVATGKSDGTAAKEDGDKIVITFSEETNQLDIDEENIDDVLALNNSHSWLDGAGNLGGASWSDSGKTLTITLSDETSLPTVAIGDVITVSEDITDEAGNEAAGTKAITGSFAATPTGGTCEDEDEDGDEVETSMHRPGHMAIHDEDDGDEDEGCDDFGRACTSAAGIINGRLYRVQGSETVYLAAGCRLKPFRGAAVFHARGHKFQDIITLSSLEGIAVSAKPALPAGGTLVKGSDKTVWFVTEGGKKKGFSSENAFRRLGFNFNSVKQIADSDLIELTTDTAIDETTPHPEGAVLKCTTSQTVYMMKGNKKFAFTNPQPYLERGHTWDAIAVVDCNMFNYQGGENIAQ
jgi:hypothetical protein